MLSHGNKARLPIDLAIDTSGDITSQEFACKVSELARQAHEMMSYAKVHRNSIMSSITMQYPTLLVIGFGDPLSTCTTHLLAKTNQDQGSWLLSKFKL